MVKTRLFLILGVMLLTPLAVSAATIYTGTMVGSNEVPPNASPATGFSTITVDGNMLMVDIEWDGLTGGNPGAAHIHCCTDPGSNIGVAVGFPDFPATTSGTYLRTFDLLDSTIYTANFLNNFGGGTAEGARDALIAGLDAGRAYSNIHNATFPGGEIRADLSAIPEPSTALLLGVSLICLGRVARRRLAPRK